MDELLKTLLPQLGVGGCLAITLLYILRGESERNDKRYAQLLSIHSEAIDARNERLFSVLGELKNSVEANTKVMSTVLQLKDER